MTDTNPWLPQVALVTDKGMVPLPVVSDVTFGSDTAPATPVEERTFAASHSVTLEISVNTGGFFGALRRAAIASVRATYDVAYLRRVRFAAATGVCPGPPPPYPRRLGGLTAREYRAARRAYARALRASARAHQRGASCCLICQAGR